MSRVYYKSTWDRGWDVIDKVASMIEAVCLRIFQVGLVIVLAPIWIPMSLLVLGIGFVAGGMEKRGP